MRNKKKKDDVSVSKIETAPIKKIYEQLPINKLKINMIKSGVLTKVHLDAYGSIEIGRSWLELCLIMLGAIHNNHRDNFLNVLAKNKVLANGFDVTAREKTVLEETPLKTYNILGTSFYLITDGSSKNLMNSILKMSLALGLKKDDIKFDIVPVGKQSKAVKLTDGTVRFETVKCDVLTAVDIINDSWRIKSISILHRKITAGTFIEAVMILVNWIVEVYGEEKLIGAVICNDKSVGITDDEEVNCISIMKIPETKLFIYNNHSANGCVKFMSSLCKYYNLSTDLIILEVNEMKFSRTVGQ